MLGRLCKFGLDEGKHLMWKLGGVPCIDKELWDGNKNRIDQIYIRTNKLRRFRVNAKLFDAKKKEVDFGFGKQYYVDKEFWDITEQPKPKPEVQPAQQATLPTFPAVKVASDYKEPEEEVDIDDIERYFIT